MGVGFGSGALRCGVFFFFFFLRAIGESSIVFQYYLTTRG